MKKTNSNFHPKNKHKSGYDLDALCKIYPGLQQYVFINKYENKTVHFADPSAVKALNKALLFRYYKITYWEFPDANLCPPIPGRVDYIHYLADLLKSESKINNISVLDIGTGATCVYPILGNAEYNWEFVGTDIDNLSLKNAQQIIDKNELNDTISLRHQKDTSKILEGVLSRDDEFTISMCNPPFYKSEEDALEATTRKLKGLKKEEKGIIKKVGSKTGSGY